MLKSMRNTTRVAILSAAIAAMSGAAYAQADPRFDPYLTPLHATMPVSSVPQGQAAAWEPQLLDFYVNMAPALTTPARVAGGQRAAEPPGTLAGTSIPVKLLGGPAPSSSACHSVEIDQATREVRVTQGQIVKFVANGKEFTWAFDGFATSYPLNSVLPAGALNHQVIAYVTPVTSAQ